MSLSKVFCSGCGCCGSGEAGNEMDELWRGCYLTAVRQHPLHSAHLSPTYSPEPQQP
jgi:hypothetical protein